MPLFRDRCGIGECEGADLASMPQVRRPAVMRESVGLFTQAFGWVIAEAMKHSFKPRGGRFEGFFLPGGGLRAAFAVDVRRSRRRHFNLHGTTHPQKRKGNSQ
jgi:hypothetical protein